MKKRLPSFLAGFLCAILLISLTVGVYAASEWPKTIEVGHINIMVNGKEFQPTDSKGRPVDVFVYKGTTYAPLRALAEAYGLDVWYDSASNLAAVGPKGSAPSTTIPPAQSKPDVTEMYTAETYYPYSVPSITAVTQLRPVRVSDSTAAEIPNYTYRYYYDEYTWNFYKSFLQSKGYEIRNTSWGIVDGYDVYVNGVYAMNVQHFAVGSTNEILVFVYVY